jgi:uncharacterized damage-inducible protein DinB
VTLQIAKRPTSAKVTKKQHVLNDLLESRDRVHAAIRGISPADVEAPLAPGKWSVRETVLHLCFWEYSIVQALDSAARGVPPRWEDNDAEKNAELNAEGHARFGSMSWAQAAALLRSGRASLLAALERIPADPADQWTGEHVLGRMLLDIAPHERHHAEQILRWRAEQGL